MKPDYYRFFWIECLLLECKYCYYLQPTYKNLSDYDYDKYEEEYKKLAKKLKRKPWASDMVGFSDINDLTHKIVRKCDLQKSISYEIIDKIGE